MNTITPKYWGRTGNVLFQIAAVIYYSNQQNRPFLLPAYEGLPNLENYTAKSFGLDESEYIASLSEYSETDIHNGAPFPEKGNILLSGFFQNYRFCDEYKDYLFDVIGIHSIRNRLTDLLKGYTDDITISLHIRRGDYENLKCYFILLDEFYYKNALLHIFGCLRTQGHNKRIHVICFSEQQSQETAKQIIQSLKTDRDILQYPITFSHFADISDNSKLTDVEDLVVMSHCNHHIIANSTYSWWGAYINPSPTKIVCCPDQWYNHQLYYLSIEGFKSNGVVMIPAWNNNKTKCSCF